MHAEKTGPPIPPKVLAGVNLWPSGKSSRLEPQRNTRRMGQPLISRLPSGPPRCSRVGLSIMCLAESCRPTTWGSLGTSKAQSRLPPMGPLDPTGDWSSQHHNSSSSIPGSLGWDECGQPVMRQVEDSFGTLSLRQPTVHTVLRLHRKASAPASLFCQALGWGH